MPGEEENSKKVKSVAGLLVTPRPISPLRYRAGRLSPSTTSRWPGIGGGTGESRGVATPPKGAYTSVIPCHFPSGAGEIQRESHPTEGLGLNAVIPLPARGVGIGWGGTPKRTRGAGAPGGGGWDWVVPQKRTRGAGAPEGCKNRSGAPPLPRPSGRQRPREACRKTTS